MRKPTFLARKEWKTVPWSAKGCTKDIMENLLEQVVDLPAVLWRFDRYTQALQSPTASSASLHRLSRKLHASTTKFESRLRRWKRDFADSYPPGQPYEVPALGDGSTFPVFTYFSPLNNAIITPPILTYPTPQLARTLCMYYAALLLLTSVDMRPAGIRISPLEGLDCARSICRSMEYYIGAVPGNMVNRMAFPLRVAYDALPERGGERAFVREVWKLVERRNRLRAWGMGGVPDLEKVKVR
jgi:hypothetical protein